MIRIKPGTNLRQPVLSIVSQSLDVKDGLWTEGYFTGRIIVSQVEKDAINKAHQQKLNDAGPTYTDPLPDELMIQAIARKYATEYLLGETLTLDLPISQIPAIKGETTEDQRKQFSQFEQAYLKAYREYPLPNPPRKKLFGIF